MTAGDIKIRTGDHGDQFSGVVANGAGDYIQIDSLAVAEAAAANVVGTISGWINVPNITGTFALLALGCNAQNEYIQFSIKAGKLNIVNRDQAGAHYDVVSTTATVTPHKWHHICVVHTGGAIVGRPFLYLDGVAVAMTDTTSTDLTAWTDTLPQVDKGCIGALNKQAAISLDYLGGISYVKYATGIAASGADWTAAQVKQEYDYRAGKGSATGVTTGVVARWELNGAVSNTANPGTYDGTIVSDVQYDSEYSNMTSKLRLLAPVVADNTVIVPHGMDGGYTAVVVKAA